MAVNGIPFLVYHVDGKGKPEGLTLDFDDCNGHIDRARSRYHYHGPPHCLLKKLGSAVPRNSSWWTFRNTSSWLCLQVCQKKMANQGDSTSNSEKESAHI